MWDIYQKYLRTDVGHLSRVYVSPSQGLVSDTHREIKIHVHACPIHMQTDLFFPVAQQVKVLGHGCQAGSRP
jgi:hypothetical protein